MGIVCSICLLNEGESSDVPFPSNFDLPLHESAYVAPNHFRAS